MAREMPVKTSRLVTTLKFGALTAAVLVALSLGLFGSAKPREAQAEPIHAVALNEALCIALGTAFGGIPATTAAFSCQGMMNQYGANSFQTYVGCLAKLRAPDGTLSCPQAPAANEVLLRPPTDFFAGLDLDKNQIFKTQPYEIIAFVDDDFPVRFITQKGNFVTPQGSVAGQDLFCAPGSPQYPGNSLDPDCDGDESTIGDGVVVARLLTDDSDGDSGTFGVNVIQENIAFPLEMTLTGPPHEIVLTTLFGKDTIQTGATDCEFAATADAVLGAIGKAEQTIVVAKALDTHGVEVVGALMTWHRSNTLPSQPPFGAADAEFTKPKNKFGTGGVALGQTPTLDAGPLGVAFPQFVCGGSDTGTIDLEVVFDPILSSTADEDTHTAISIKVIGPATDMTLTAEPAVIDCDGINTSKVTANVVNAAGDPVANGLDVDFSVVALGTANPLRTDATAGLASTVVQPLSGAGSTVADAGPKGVTVTVSAKGALNRFDENEDPTWQTVTRSILVQCTGGPPPPGTGGGAGAGTGPPTGTIRPPDTGSAGNGSGTLGWAMLAVLAAAGLALGSASFVTRRK